MEQVIRGVSEQALCGNWHETALALALALILLRPGELELVAGGEHRLFVSSSLRLFVDEVLVAVERGRDAQVPGTANDSATRAPDLADLAATPRPAPPRIPG